MAERFAGLFQGNTANHLLLSRLDASLTEITSLQGGMERIKNTVFPDNVILELKVEEEQKKKRTQRSLEVEIEWFEGEESGGALTLG